MIKKMKWFKRKKDILKNIETTTSISRWFPHEVNLPSFIVSIKDVDGHIVNWYMLGY